MPPLTKETFPGYGIYKVVYDQQRAAFDDISKMHEKIGRENGVGEPIDELYFKWTAEYAGYLVVKEGGIIVRGNSIGVKIRTEDTDAARANAAVMISSILGKEVVDGGN